MRVILTPGPCNFHRITKVDAIVVNKLQERAAPFVLLHRSKNPPITTFSNYACHACTGVMPSVSNSRCVTTQAKKPNTHQRLLKYVPSLFKSIRSHGVSDQEIRTIRVPPEQMIESSIGPISEPSSVQSTQHVFVRCVPW